MVDEKRAELERILGYEFVNGEYVDEALTHSSVKERADADRDGNSRLAHLGDAVVELAVRNFLFRRFPDATKGDLSKAKADIVSGAGLAKTEGAKRIAAILDRGGSRPKNLDNNTVLAEAFEAAIASVFLDSSFERAAPVVERLVTFPDKI